MKENQIPDFDLEDIIKEFSEKPAAKAQPEHPFTLEEAMAFDAPARKPVKKAKPEVPEDAALFAALKPREQAQPQAQELTLEEAMDFDAGEDVPEISLEEAMGVTPSLEETVRFAPVTEEAAQADISRTMAFTPVTEEAAKADLSQTMAFTPVTEAREPDTGATRVLPQVPDQEQTIRMAPVSQFPRGKVRDALPVENEGDTRVLPDVEGGWEPEYEQPMGSYPTSPRVLQHPQSRLRELKRKLVSGPEKEYYALSEKGFGKLQLAIFLSLLVAAVAAVVTVLYGFGHIGTERHKTVIFTQLLALLFSGLLASFQMIDGVADLFKGRFTMNTLLVCSFLLCCADGFFCLKQLRIPCCAAFGLQATFALWSSYHSRRTRMGQMDTLRRATNLTAIRASDAQLDNSRVLLRSDGQVEDFMDTYAKPTTADKVMCWYALGALIAALGVGVLDYVGSRDISRALQLASVSLLAAAPATGFICQSRPKAVLEKRLRTVGTVLCGWDGVKAAKGKVIFPVEHTDLFPAGCAKMNGVKFFGQRSTDEIVAYATALIHAADGGLAPLFKQVLESRNCRLLGVENLRHYDDGGIGGEVMDEPVLMGTLSFLRSMGVEVPEGLRVSQAVCVSIDGELCGLFAITYEKNRDAFLGLTALNNYRGVTPILNVLDHLLTPGFLRAKFGIQPKRLLFADQPVRQQLARLDCREDAPAIALTTRSGLASLAYGVTGARALHTACWLGAILQIIGGVLGIGIMVALVLLEGAALLTSANVFLLQLVWIIPSLLITEWSRAI